MKSLLAILMLCFLVSKANAQFDKYITPKQILDSVEVLTNFDGVVCGYSWNEKDSFLNRYARISGYSPNISYKKCNDLMSNANNIKKAYGFIYALRKYPEDITTDLPIFDIKDSINVYNRKHNGLEVMPLGAFCNLKYKEKMYSDSMSLEIDKLALAVRTFFDENAKYPASIESDESGGTYNTESEGIKILQFQVTYTIKDKNGLKQTIKNQSFEFNEKGEIVFLKKGKNDSKIKDNKLKEAWLNKFGK